MGVAPRATDPGVTRPVLERATHADLAEVTALERECYPDPWPQSAFATLPDHPHVHFLVAREAPGGRIVGYSVAWFVADEGELANLAVAAGFRGRGFGTALLEAVLRDAAGQGVTAVYLEVRESNVAARKLYESRDFVEVGRRREYYRTPVEDALILRCTIERLLK